MTIHEDAVAAFQSVYDKRIADLEVVISDLDSELGTAGDEIEALIAERTTLLAEIESLKVRIAELEEEEDDVPEGWAVLYDSTFSSDDGWEKRQETQSNDNSYNTPKNVSFGERGLVILGKRESLGGKPFTTGDVLGRHVRMPNYYRAEVTGLSPTAYGMWPCLLWMRPLTHGDAGETDAMETWTYDWSNTGAMVWGTIHNAYTTTDPKQRKANAGLPYSALVNSDPAAAHTYTVIKTKGRTEILVDGVRLWCWEKGAKYVPSERISPTPAWYDSVYEIPNREWYPRFTLQIGGPNSKDPVPAWQQSEMVIQRLRIFKEA